MGSNWPLVFVGPAILFGMIVAILIAMRQGIKAHKKPSDVAFLPTPKWRPDWPVDLERIANIFAHYMDQKRRFVIFENGTCVVVSQEGSNPEQEALGILDAILKQHPDFSLRAMDDGNWIVYYAEPAHTVVFRDDVEQHMSEIDGNVRDAVCPAEVLLNAQGQPALDEKAKVGLYGRARMFMDAVAPKVVQIVEAETGNSEQE